MQASNEGNHTVTLVIIAAAVGALILLLAIMALSRSRFADESERFRYVSDLTSQWSREQQAPDPAEAPADPRKSDAAASQADPVDRR
jgi:hypothetical protein